MRKPLPPPWAVALLISLIGHPVGATLARGEANPAEVVAGNTLVVVNRFGPIHVLFSPQGGWRAMAPRGSASTEGTWRLDGSQLCVTQTAPLPPSLTAPENCIALGSYAFGQAWEADDPRNGKITYPWLRGHVQP